LKQKQDFSIVLIAFACALAVLFTALFLSILPFNRQIISRRDYIVYWATGQQLVHHGNPYDPTALNQIEKDAGFQGGSSFYMRNVPWALPLALPLGYVNPQWAALPWSLLMLGLLILSVHLLLRAIGSSGGIPAWLGYCFPPALFCVILGQTSIFLLLGLVLFLSLHKSRPFAAGAALWFCTLKPHFFLPFALVLLVWIFVSRSYRVLAGALTALVAGLAITAAIDPHAWSQYAYYMRTSVITREFTPCLGNLLRDKINPAAEWLAFVPAILGSIWALTYFWPRRHKWDWFEHGNLVMLVSLVVTPFGWIFDQTLAIPAIVVAASKNVSRVCLSLLAILYIAVEIQTNRSELHSAAYLWIAPAWLAWYILARTYWPGKGVTAENTEAVVPALQTNL
jgi:Glycosyltransferase family 87